MYSRSRIYGLDIETDTATGGLDPHLSAITEIALVTEDYSYVFAGSEKQIFEDLARTLRGMQPGVVVTWNGVFFDIPFMATRVAAISGSLKEYLGMRLIPADGLTPKYSLMPGYDRAQNAVWPSAGGWFHTHLDVAYAYKTKATELGVPWSLKPVAKAMGIDMIEVDRARMHELTEQQRIAYVTSDARGTRELAIRTLGA